jgi:hypothetical protein
MDFEMSFRALDGWGGFFEGDEHVGKRSGEWGKGRKIKGMGPLKR